MSNGFLLTLTVFALVAGDVPGAERLHSPGAITDRFSSADEIAVLPVLDRGGDDQQGATQQSQNKSNATLQERSKLDLIRYVSGEFAKAIRSLPAGKEGFLVYVGKPVGWEQLERAVATHGDPVEYG